MKTISMPKLGYVSNEGTVVEWLKSEGQTVEKGETLLIMESEKTQSELTAPTSGVLYKILVTKGTTVPVGEIIGVIAEPGDGPIDIDQVTKGVVTPQEPTTSERIEETTQEGVKASPSARRLAKEHNIDLSKVTGKGPEGRITTEDVEQIIEAAKVSHGEAQVIPLGGFRKAMAERMAYATQTYAPTMSTWEVDATDLLELRRELTPKWEKEGVRVSFTAFLVKAVVEVLKANPIFNSTLQGGNVIIKKEYNIGIATAIEGKSYLEDKLFVPVIHNAEQKSLTEIGKNIEELAKKAREGLLTMEDLAGGTFTISNPGARSNVNMFTSIINPPESAILGAGKINEKPIVREGKIVIRSMMNLMLTYDHRIILPTHSARFRQTLKELLENPRSLLD